MSAPTFEQQMEALAREVDGITGGPAENPVSPANPVSARQTNGPDPILSDFDRQFREIEAQRTQTVIEVTAGAEDTDYEKSTRANDLAVEMDLPQRTVENTLERLERAKRRYEVPKLEPNSPLAKWVASDPALARVYGDDLHALGKVEKRFGDRFWDSAVNVGLRFEIGQLQNGVIGEYWKAKHEQILAGGPAPSAALTEDAEAAMARVREIRSRIDELSVFPVLYPFGAAAEMGPLLWDQAVASVRGAGVAGVIFGVGAGALSVATGGAFLPAALATGALAAKYGAIAGGALQIGQVEASFALQEMVEENPSLRDDPTTALIAAFVGMANAPLEALSLSKLAAPLRAIGSKVIRRRLTEYMGTQVGKSAVRQYLNIVGTETVTEILQEGNTIFGSLINEGMHKHYPDNPNMSEHAKFGEAYKLALENAFTDENITRALSAGVEGGAAAIVLGGFSTSMSAMSGMRELAQAEADHSLIAGIAADMEESKVAKRSPSAWARAVNKIAEGTDVETVFLPVGDWNTLMQAQGIDPAQAAEDVGAKDSYDANAADPDGSFEVKIGDYIAKIHKHPTFGELADKVRVRPDGASVEEYNEERKQARERMSDMAARADAMKAEDDEVRMEASAIEDFVVDSVLRSRRESGAGFFDRKYAQRVARVWSSFFVTAAGDATEPTSALGLFRKHLLGVHGASQVAAPAGETLDAAQPGNPAFDAWFGDSQIVDESGAPLVVYHVTAADFESFKPGGLDPGLSGPGIWFSADPTQLNAAHNVDEKRTPGARVIPAYLSMNNPAVISFDDEAGKYLDQDGNVYPDPFLLRNKEEMVERGFDGMIVHGPDQTTEYVAFEPTQVKSQFNRGTFDPSNPDILRQGPNDSRLLSAAIREKGLTENISEAGWILPDGSLLKMSDQPGMRTQDHGEFSGETTRFVGLPRGTLDVVGDDARIISLASRDDRGRVTRGMLAEGAVRLGSDDSFVEIGTNVTEPQYRAIEAAIDGGVGVVSVDFPGGSVQVDSSNPKAAVGKIRRAVRRGADRGLSLAANERGLTDDIRKAGWVLPDGRMLDFSDGFAGKTAGHYEVLRTAEEMGWVDEEEIVPGLLGLGAMRVDLAEGLVQLAGRPSEAQLSAVGEMAKQSDGETLWIDVGGNVLATEGGESPTEVVGLVRRLSSGPRTLEQRVSPRAPSGDKATEDPIAEDLQITTEVVLRDPKLAAKQAAMFRRLPNWREGKRALSDKAVLSKSIREMSANLQWLYDKFEQAFDDGAEVIERAKLWYDGANALARWWANEYGYSLSQISAAIAVLSPQNDWYNNVTLAQRVIDVFSHHQDYTIDDTMFANAETMTSKTEKPARLKEQAKLRAQASRLQGMTLREIIAAAEHADQALRAEEIIALRDEKTRKAREARTKPFEQTSAAAWEDVGFFIRLYDETYHDHGYNIAAPEGGFVGPKLNKDKKSEARKSWQSFIAIGKAAAVLHDGEYRNVSRRLGSNHKVRSFYNNIFDPNSLSGDVTIDTHAVGAGWLRPFAAKDLEPNQNFGSKGGTSEKLGVMGSYPVYADAYRAAAAAKERIAREMQSITWEAVRGLFPDTWKSDQGKLFMAELREGGATKKQIAAAWKSYGRGEMDLDGLRLSLGARPLVESATAHGIWARYQRGDYNIATAREMIYEHAGGIERPDWADSQRTDGIRSDDGAAAYSRVDRRTGRVYRGRVREAGRGGGVRGAADVAGAAVDPGGATRTLLQRAPGGLVRLRSVFSLGVGRAYARAAKRLSGPFRRGSEGGRARYDLDPDAAGLIVDAGATPVSMVESTPAEFHAAIVAAAAAHKFGASVEVKPVDSYVGSTLLLTEDGLSGIAVTPDGDIVSGFSAPGSAPGAALSMVTLATQLGGRRLDAFDTVLPKIYSKLGFRAVARLPWNDEYQPPGWDKSLFAPFNGGEPDVVFMVYDPSSTELYERGDGAVVDTYDAGQIAQDAAIGEVEAREAPTVVSDLADAAVSWFNGGRSMFQRALHGTRDRHDGDFSKSGEHIGKSNGLVFGWGLYFSTSRSIAEFYTQTGSRGATDGTVTYTFSDGKEVSFDTTLTDSDENFELANEIVRDIIGPGAADDEFDIVQDIIVTISEYGVGRDASDNLDSLIELAEERLEGTIGIRDAAAVEDPDGMPMYERNIELAKRSLAGAKRTRAKYDEIVGRFGWRRKSQVYEAEIPNDSDLLDWDLSLELQSEDMQQRARAAMREAIEIYQERYHDDGSPINVDYIGEWNGNMFYAAIHSLLNGDEVTDARAHLYNGKETSQLLGKHGIKGHRYEAGQLGGTTNYVLKINGERAPTTNLSEELVKDTLFDSMWSLYQGGFIGNLRALSEDELESVYVGALQDLRIARRRVTEGDVDMSETDAYDEAETRIEEMMESRVALTREADATNFVIWDFDSIDLVRTFYARAANAGGGTRGAVTFTDEGALVRLFEAADETTLFHEGFHVFESVLADMMKAGIASERQVADFEAMQAFADEDDALMARVRAEYPGADRQTLRHEKLAKAFEVYLYEGTAPTRALRNAFRSIKGWFVSVYRNWDSAITTEVPDSIKQVFDRMLAADDQVEARKAGADGDSVGLFAKLAETMNPEERKRFLAKVDDAGEDEKERKLARALATVKKRRAKAARRRLKTLVAEATEELKLDPAQQLREWVIGRGRWVGDGQGPAVEPRGMTRSLVVEEFGADAAERLPTRALVNEGYSPEFLGSLFGLPAHKAVRALAERLPLRDEANRVAQARLDAEVDPSAQSETDEAFAEADRDAWSDVLAARLRHLRTLAGREPLRKAAARVAADEGGGEPIDAQETIQAAEATLKAAKEAREAAVGGEAVAEADDRLRSAELQMAAARELGPAKGTQRRAERAAVRAARQAEASALAANAELKDEAADWLDRQQIGDLNLGKLAGLAKRRARAVRRAVAARDYALAAENTELELFWTHALALARDAQKKIGVARRYHARLGKAPAKKRIGNRNKLRHMDHILDLMDRFGLADKRSLRAVGKEREVVSSIFEYITEVEAETGHAFNLDPEARRAMARSANTHWKELTVAEFLGVTDLIKNIERISRDENSIRLDGETVDLIEVAARFDQEIDEAGFPERGRAARLNRTDKNWDATIEDTRASLRKFRAFIVKPEFYFRWLGGGKAGYIWRTLYQPIQDAQNKRELLSAEMFSKLVAITTKHFTDAQRKAWRRERIFIPEMGESVTMDTIVSVAFHQGTEDNAQKLVDGHTLKDGKTPWEQKHVEAMLTHMEREHWAYVKDVWGLIGSYWPQIKALEERVNGFAPRKVEGRTVKTRFGDIEGEYFPIKLDGRLASKAEGFEQYQRALSQLGGNWASSMTQHGFTEERVRFHGLPVRLDTDVITEHLADLALDLSHREALIGVNAVIKNPMVKQRLEEVGGRELYDMLNPWLVRIATDNRALPSASGERIFAATRAGASAVSMGWKVTTALMQPLGAINSVIHLENNGRFGTAYMAKGFGHFFHKHEDPNSANHKINTLAWIQSKSQLMANRRTNFDREVRDLQARYFGGESKLDKVRETLFWMTSWTDQAVSAVSWMGAYEQAMDGNATGFEATDADAVKYADMIVRISQGSGLPKDLAGIQSQSEAWKLATMFYSYHSVVLSHTMEKAGMNRSAFALAHPRMIATYAFMYILPEVMAEVVTMRIFDRDDDEDLEEFLAKKAVTSMFQPYPIIRDVANAIVNDRDYEVSGMMTVAAAVKFGQQAKQGELDAALASSGFSLVGGVLRLPGRQAYITLGALYDYFINGEEDMKIRDLALYRRRD